MKITKIDYYLPEKIVTNEELLKLFPDWDSISFEKKVGIKSRHIANKDETALDLGFKAAEKILSDDDKGTIDFVIFCTQSPDYFLPSGACILQNKLELKNTNIGATDINLGCSGFVYGLSMAKGLLAGEIATKVLFITAETYSKHIHPKDRTNRSIFGDGASACLIEKHSKTQIGKFVLGTDGKGYDKLITKNGAFRHPYDMNTKEKKYGSNNIYNDNHIYMNGPDIFNFSIEKVPPLIEATLIKNELNIEDIDYFIYHQANAFMLNFLRKKSKIPQDKFYIDLENVGNTVSSTIPIGLAKMLSSHQIKKGNKVMLVGFGVGLSWGATIITI